MKSLNVGQLAKLRPIANRPSERRADYTRFGILMIFF